MFAKILKKVYQQLLLLVVVTVVSVTDVMVVTVVVVVLVVSMHVPQTAGQLARTCLLLLH